jgi:CRP-like cAMP-binding protein
MRNRDVLPNLTGWGWLAEIDPALAARVVAAGRLVQLERGASLYYPGDTAGGMYGVVSGGIVIAPVGRDGLPVAGHILRRCEWFGYGSLLDTPTRSLVATANEPSVVLHVPVSEVDRLRAEFPASARAFGRLAVVGAGMYALTIADLLIANTDRRIAAVLLRVTGASFPGRTTDRPVDPVADPWAGPEGVPLTQALLAELANASPHTVARFVERGARAGWIDWRYGRVRILDLERLAAFAAGQGQSRDDG